VRTAIGSFLTGLALVVTLIGVQAYVSARCEAGSSTAAWDTFVTPRKGEDGTDAAVPSVGCPREGVTSAENSGGLSEG